MKKAGKGIAEHGKPGLRAWFPIIFAVCACLLASVPLSFVSADEPATYSLASALNGRCIQVAPSGEGAATLYFYNVEGNRITHLALSTSDLPDGWNVELDPGEHETQVEVNGVQLSVIENLCVAPSDLLQDEPDEVPVGMAALNVPGCGYAMAKPVKVIVSAPESAAIGQQLELTVTADAWWLGQSGTVTIRQARDFEFSVDVVAESAEFTENVLVERRGLMTVAVRWLPTIVGVVLVLLGVLIMPRYVAWRNSRRD